MATTLVAGPSALSPSEADGILKAGYPDDDTLLRFPLGAQLASIPSIDSRYPGHIRKVFEGVEIMVSGQPHGLVAQWKAEPQLAAQFTLDCQEILTGREGKPALLRLAGATPRFLRLLALYHDIGKSVIVERHPLVGSHLLKEVHQREVENELYPLLLGRDSAEWRASLDRAKEDVSQITSTNEKRLLRLFHAVVLYHDYFGVLSTGEGSLTAMVDLIDITGADPVDAQETFSLLMIFNLADAYGSVPEVLPQKVDAYTSDWRTLCELINDSKGDRVRFFQELRKRTQTIPEAIRRLWRLIYEGAPAIWLPRITREFVGDIFRDVRLSARDRFAENFALFSKLDYCLGFKRMLMDHALQDGQDLSVPVAAMLGILSELEFRYGDLCRREQDRWRRIGIEMAGLTRKPVGAPGSSKIGETICQLLLQPGPVSGKQWAIGECTTWLMEE